MTKYLCCFEHEKEPNYEVDTYDPESAAEQFAVHAQYCKDGWELPDHWDGDYSVLVKDTTSGEITKWSITREYEPVFTATKEED